MKLESVSYHIKDKVILKDISLQIAEGEIAFLFGRNGSGKTTLLNLMSNVLNPTSGKIYCAKSFFYLPTSPYLDRDLLVDDVYDILECNKSLIEKNQQLLQTRHLNKKHISQISSGEYKRVWLVAALSQSRQIFLLDEPLSYLDWPFQKVLQSIIIKMSLQGHSFVMTTHDFNWALGFQKASAWILPSPIKKYKLIEALKSKTFQKVFQCISQITDNPLNRDKILALDEA